MAITKYTESDAVKSAREKMETQSAAKPAAYQSKWQTQLDDTIGQIMNRKPFAYDLNGDALYQQYKDQYVTGGKMAMMDTMGQAQAMTGGYGNSYAQGVGQQAYQGYLQGLNDKIPELYQLALSKYNLDGQNLMDQYGVLGAQDQTDYGRYMDGYNQWATERDYLSNRYNTERSYDYGQYRDTVGDQQWQAEFDEAMRRYNYEHQLGPYAPKVSASGGGGGEDDDAGGSSYTPKPKEKTVEEVYMENKKNGAKATELDAYLKASISEGKISQKAASDLRDKRW